MARTFQRVKRSIWALALGGFLSPLAGHAQSVLVIDKKALREFVAAQIDPALGKAEVTLGEIKAAPHLAPCQAMEPFVPAGARLWGAGHIGLRCTQGARWQTFIPVSVRIRGRALVAQRELPPGTPLDSGDFKTELVELTGETGLPVRDDRALAGRALARPIKFGEILRIDHLKSINQVNAGDLVKVRWVGQGFTVVSEGVAMAAAGPSGAVRVRTESGRVVSGVIRDRVVEVQP